MSLERGASRSESSPGNGDERCRTPGGGKRSIALDIRRRPGFQTADTHDISVQGTKVFFTSLSFRNSVVIARFSAKYLDINCNNINIENICIKIAVRLDI